MREVSGTDSAPVARHNRSTYICLMLQTYPGSCHCGAVRFEADLDLAQPTYRCNCSICRRTRFWAAVAREDGVRVLQGHGELAQSLFHTRTTQHYFSRTCGVRPFGIGTETPMGRMYGVNIGCLEGVSEEQLSQLKIVHVDGMNGRLVPPPFCSHL